MKRTIANVLSGMFHPLLMVTYGVILALTYTYLAIYPMGMKLSIVGGVFVMTAIVPALFIWIMYKTGMAGDLDLTNRKERTLPYIIFATSLLATGFLLYKLRMPVWFLLELFGACAALLIAMLINHYWKISAHMIGVGGLVGGILGAAHIQMINPYEGIMIAFVVSGLVGTSRLILKRHTPMQVYAGFMLGFTCVFLSSLLSFILFFI